jgi:hypothetical protein
MQRAFMIPKHLGDMLSFVSSCFRRPCHAHPAECPFARRYRDVAAPVLADCTGNVMIGEGEAQITTSVPNRNFHDTCPPSLSIRLPRAPTTAVI